MYLSGAKNRLMSDDLAAGRVGLLQTPAAAYRLDDVAVWAMDNGCFTDTYPGDDAYLATLDKYAHHQARCLFVAVPDVVGDAAATLALFPAMAARISAAGWPVALVAQDGMTADDLPDGLPWLFIGGSTEWKLGHAAAELIAEAKRRGCASMWGGSTQRNGLRCSLAWTATPQTAPSSRSLPTRTSPRCGRGWLHPDRRGGYDHATGPVRRAAPGGRARRRRLEDP